MGFETNLNNNARRKELKYRPLLTDLANDYKQVKSANLSTCNLGIFEYSPDTFIKLCIERGMENRDLNFIISKLSTVIIHPTYHIVYMIIKTWSDPGILNY